MNSNREIGSRVGVENVLERYSSDFLTGLLEQMTLIRRFEQKAAQMYGVRKIGGFCHIYIGQEAVCTGAVAAMDMSKDYVLTAYRDHGFAIVLGMEPGVIMAELFGKVTGCSKGKGGSMHLFDADRHFYGGTGIVGAHIPLSAGVALKVKYCREGGVVVCFFGDGAIHQGTFHETLNMAGVWKLPVVFVCENNQYGMGTDYRRVSAVHELWSLSESYNLPGRLVDGMDVLEVYEGIKEAVGRAREDSEGSLIEIKTYRYMGHSMSDPATYRTREELEKYKRQDPILIFKEKLAAAGVLDEDGYKRMDESAKEAVARAVEFAEQSAEPAVETIFEDVLA